MKDFSHKTISDRRRKGITITELTLIPDKGEMLFANGERGYISMRKPTRVVIYLITRSRVIWKGVCLPHEGGRGYFFHVRG